MSHIFKVGDRVRVISAEKVGIGSMCVGKEGVVNELFCTSTSGKSGRIGVTVMGCKPPFAGYNENDWCFESHQLEPLNPPKSQIDEILAMQNLPDRDCQKVAA